MARPILEICLLGEGTSLARPLEDDLVHQLARHILPIYVFPTPTKGVDSWPLRFAGTGFVLSPNLFVTCAHCVTELPPGEVYAAATPDSEGGRSAHYLQAISADPSGSDLATAWIDLAEPAAYTLRRELPEQVIDVGTIGYPGTFFELHADNTRRFDEQERYFQGYITRAFNYKLPREGRTVPSYEVDMPAPRGLSGAPLISTSIESRGQIVGVIYGAHPPFGTESEGEGEIRLPPTIFALAHHHSTLMNLRGTTTEGRPIADILAQT